MDRKRIVVVAAAAVSLVATSCGGEEEARPEGESPTPGPTPTPVITQPETPLVDGTIEVNGAGINFHDAADVSGQGGVELELDDFYFEPSVLFGEPGQQVRLTLRNDGSATHTFTLDDEVNEVDVSVLPEETRRAEVVFPESGAVVFVCRFHEGQGMRGALAVEGAIDLPDDDLEDDA